METQIALTSRLDRIVDGLEYVGGTLVILQALGISGKVSHPETRRDRWLSEHLDRSFSKEPETSDLPSIMEVVLSKGLHYFSRVCGIQLTILDVLSLKTRFRIIPSFLSQPLRPSFWAIVVENLEESGGRLLALPPSQGQILSNRELFASILEDAQRAMTLDPPTPLTDSEDDDLEYGRFQTRLILSEIHPGVGDPSWPCVWEGPSGA